MTAPRLRMEEAQEELLVSAEHLHFVAGKYHFSMKTGTTSVYVPIDLARHMQLQNGDDVMLVLVKKRDWQRLEEQATKLDLRKGEVS